MAIHDPDEAPSPPRALEGDENPLSSPVTPERRPDPYDLVGETVAGQYKVLEWCGGGGMGVVYRAYDTRLGRPVALKFLPASLTGNRQARHRFVVEARVASSVEHDNICTVHNIGETGDGKIFIAMAFYDGETLKKKIARGALPVAEALSYATQIAGGLAAAHAERTIHRDIKPANVMLTRGGVVKIVDFGIARNPVWTATPDGPTAGTPAYMSPEQLNPELRVGDEPDHHTDIWSLGVVLYEMLTGIHPFESGEQTAAQVITAVLNHDPVPPGELNPKVGEEIDEIVFTCLKKKPGERYANILDLQSDLEAASRAHEFRVGAGREGTLARPAPVGIKNRLARTGWAAVVLAALATLVSLNPALRGRVLGSIGLASAYPRTHVAVLPIAISGPADEALEALAAGLQRELTRMVSGLQRGEDSLWVLPASEISRQNVTTTAEARRVFNVDLVLSGTLRSLGSTAELDLDLIDTTGPRVLDTRTIPGPGDPGFTVAAAEALVGLLGLPQRRYVARLTDDRGSSAPGAQHFYVQGVGYLSRYDVPGNLDNAVIEFTHAIEEDPTFAAAHAGLCEARFELYRRSAVTLHARESRESCDRAARLGQDQPEVLISVASQQLQSGEVEKAERNLERASALDPENPDALRWLGRVYERENRLDAAEQAYRQAIATKPGGWIYYNELGQMLAYASRHEEALAQFRSVVRLTPDNHLGYLGLGYSLSRLGRLDEAMEQIERSIEKRPSSQAYRILGHLSFQSRRFAEAIDDLERGVALGEGDFLTWRWLGHAYYWNGDRERAAEAWRRTTATAEARLQVDPFEIDALCALAETYVVLGDRERGREYLDLVLTQTVQPNYNVYYVARIYELLGNRDAAFIYLERALRSGYADEIPDQDPWLASLREDPRFLELVQALDRDP